MGNQTAAGGRTVNEWGPRENDVGRLTTEKYFGY